MQPLVITVITTSLNRFMMVGAVWQDSSRTPLAVHPIMVVWRNTSRCNITNGNLLVWDKMVVLAVGEVMEKR